MAFLIDSFLLFIAEKILEQAEKELMNEDEVRQELRELYEQLESGRITEEGFEKREEELVKRLEEIEEYKKEKPEARRPPRGSGRASGGAPPAAWRAGRSPWWKSWTGF